MFELIIHLDCLGAVKHDDFFEQLRKQLETHRLEPSVSCLEDHPSKDTWLGSPISAINFGHLKKGSHNPNWGTYKLYGWFRKWRYPQIIHFNRVFHYFHHPFWGIYPSFWKHPYGYEPRILVVLGWPILHDQVGFSHAPEVWIWRQVKPWHDFPRIRSPEGKRPGMRGSGRSVGFGSEDPVITWHILGDHLIPKKPLWVDRGILHVTS